VHPPFFLTLPNGSDDWAYLRLDGYTAGRRVISRRLSSRGTDQHFDITADHNERIADGSDATRIVLRVSDQYGEPRPLCFDPVRVTFSGSATLLGAPELAFAGGHSAVWIRVLTEPGTVVVTAAHPTQGGERQLRLVSPTLPSWEPPEKSLVEPPARLVQSISHENGVASLLPTLVRLAKCDHSEFRRMRARLLSGD